MSASDVILLAESECAPDSLQQGLVGDGFGEKVYRACFHRLHGGLDVARATDENNGQGVGPCSECLLQVQAAWARETNVQQDAGRAFFDFSGEKGAGAGITPHDISSCSQRPRDKCLERLVVVHNVDNWRLLRKEAFVYFTTFMFVTVLGSAVVFYHVLADACPVTFFSKQRKRWLHKHRKNGVSTHLTFAPKNGVMTAGPEVAALKRAAC